jgi:arylsulfatase A-like enzyme
MASFRASARALDQGVGTVLNALEENGLADDTLVFLTTDHGLAFPDAKCTMYDRGIGVMLMMRGPGGFERGRVHDALVSHLDLYPTICDVAGIERPPWLEGTSLLPLVSGEVTELHEELFAEVTYHAAYEPQRAVRTSRYKYMRRYDEQHPGRVLANLDDSATKDVLLAAGWAEVDPPWEALYDLWLDPAEATNRIDDPRLAGVADDLRSRLEAWMARTHDPLLKGPVPPAEGTVTNTVDQISASDPTTPPTEHSLTHSHRARNAADTTDAGEAAT